MRDDKSKNLSLKKKLLVILIISILVLEFIFRFYYDTLSLLIMIEVPKICGTYYTMVEMIGQSFISNVYQLTKINFFILYPIMTFLQSGEVMLLLYLVAKDSMKAPANKDKERTVTFN